MYKPGPGIELAKLDELDWECLPKNMVD